MDTKDPLMDNKRSLDGQQKIQIIDNKKIPFGDYKDPIQESNSNLHVLVM